ncbi:MAG: ATP-grasp domain-containing protein [bacterium]
MSRLLENDSLDLMARHGVPVPAYRVAGNPAEAAAALEDLGGRAVLKALVPTGKRGKAGAVSFVSSPGEAGAEAARILDLTVGHFPVKRLIVMEALDIRREFFLSITFDPTHASPVVLFSPAGGVDIEEIIGERPDQLFELPVDITRGLEAHQCTALAERAGLEGSAALQCGRAIHGLYEMFCEHDCRTVEVNPLAELSDGRVTSGSGVVVLDEQALFRHPDLAEKFGEEQGNGWRPLTGLELEVREIDAINPHASAIRFNELDGDIAFMVSGGGYGLSSLEQLLREGGRPACTFDITPGPFEEKMYRMVKAVLGKPGLRGLVLSANVSNFAQVDLRVAGIVRALKETNIDYGKIPVVVRYAGPGVERARELIAEVPDVEWHEGDFTLEDLCRRIVDRAYGRSGGEAE